MAIQKPQVLSRGLDGNLAPLEGHLAPLDSHLAPLNGHLAPMDGHLVRLDGPPWGLFMGTGTSGWPHLASK